MGEHADGELHGWRRWRLRLHLLLCHVCRRYLSTYRTTIRAVKGAHATEEERSDTPVPDELLKAILKGRRPG